MGKYGEPWRYNGDDDSDANLVASDGRPILCGVWYNNSDAGAVVERPEDAARITVCVNACSHIPNPEAVPGLVEAVRELLDDIEHDDHRPGDWSERVVVKNVRAALKRAGL